MQLEQFTRILFTSGGTASRKISDWIQDTSELPQKPSYLLKMLRLANSASQKDLTKELIKNKDLLAKVMNLPSMSQQPGHISEQDIENAISNLEKTFVQNSLEIDIAKKYKKALLSLDSQDMETWLLSVKTAVISKAVSAWLGQQDLEISFMAGLLKHFPSLLMKVKDPESTFKVREAMSKGAKEREAELITHGFDHCEFGVKLFKYFALPEALIELSQHDYSADSVKAKYKNLAQIVNFAEFVAKSFSDKTQSPSSMWTKAQPYIKSLGLNMSAEEWANKISILFVKSLEFEMSAFA